MTERQKNFVRGTIVLFFVFAAVLYGVIGFVLMSWSTSSWPIGVLVFYRFMLVVAFTILGFSIHFNYNKIGQEK